MSRSKRPLLEPVKGAALASPLRRGQQPQAAGDVLTEKDPPTCQRDIPLHPGDLHLTTKLEGFAAEHLSLSLKEGEARYVEFSLNKGKTIRGDIHDSGGNPLGGASVSIAYAQEVSESRSIKAAYQWERGEAKTGKLGKFEIKDVHPEKQFIVVVSRPDFLSAVSAPKQVRPDVEKD